MRYVMLVYTDESRLPGLMTPDAIAQFEALGRELSAAGRLDATVGLAPVASATTVRVREGRAVVTDGPFAETREQLGGLSVAEFDSLEDALAHAARIPTAVAGCVEVRPVLDFHGHEGSTEAP